MRNIYLGLVVSLFFLTSCEGNTDEYFNVTNSTNSSLTLEFVETYFNSDTIQTIAAGETKLVAIYTRLGGSPTANGPIVFDTVTVFNATDTMVTNFVYEQNWTHTSEQTSKVPSAYEHMHTLVITEADF